MRITYMPATDYSQRKYPKRLKHHWALCPYCFWMTITYRGKYVGGDTYG